VDEMEVGNGVLLLVGSLISCGSLFVLRLLTFSFAIFVFINRNTYVAVG
jgi:hypothetical protein